MERKECARSNYDKYKKGIKESERDAKKHKSPKVNSKITINREYVKR